MNAQASQHHRPRHWWPLIRAVRTPHTLSPGVHGAVSTREQSLVVSGQPVQRQQQWRSLRRLEAGQALRLVVERESAARHCRGRESRLRYQDQTGRPQPLQLVRTGVVSNRSMRRQARSSSYQNSAKHLAQNQFERTTGGSMLNHGWFNQGKSARKPCTLNHPWFSHGVFATSIEPPVVTFLDIPRAEPVLLLRSYLSRMLGELVFS